MGDLRNRRGNRCSRGRTAGFPTRGRARSGSRGHGLKGQGRGGFLLVDALRRCFENAANVAAVAVVVEAKDDAAAAFYRHFRFLALQTNPGRLYLPMKTVAQLAG